MRIEVPEGSLYFWCFEMGLKGAALSEVELAVRCAGRELRDKDVANYWNGWYRSTLYCRNNSSGIFMLKHEKPAPTPSSSFLTMDYEDYPEHPFIGLPEVSARWIPCDKENKPMFRWGNGCLQYEDAMAWPGREYVAENTKGTKFVIVDCDGDHDRELDFRTISRLSRYKTMTHTLSKPKMIKEYEGYEGTGIEEPASFHLTFTTDKVIPTMHFPFASMDIIGNKMNSLRYRKNKVWNGLQPAPMTPEIWGELQRYVRSRKEKQ